MKILVIGSAGFIGYHLTKKFMEMQLGDVESTYADTKDLIDDFGYKPNTKLADGISKFIKWYQGFYNA